MVYKIRDADGDVYIFKNAKELLIALQKALGSEHEYYDSEFGEIKGHQNIQGTCRIKQD